MKKYIANYVFIFFVLFGDRLSERIVQVSEMSIIKYSCNSFSENYL